MQPLRKRRTALFKHLSLYTLFRRGRRQVVGALASFLFFLSSAGRKRHSCKPGRTRRLSSPQFLKSPFTFLSLHSLSSTRATTTRYGAVAVSLPFCSFRGAHTPVLRAGAHTPSCSFHFLEVSFHFPFSIPSLTSLTLCLRLNRWLGQRGTRRGTPGARTPTSSTTSIAAGRAVVKVQSGDSVSLRHVRHVLHEVLGVPRHRDGSRPRPRPGAAAPAGRGTPCTGWLRGSAPCAPPARTRTSAPAQGWVRRQPKVRHRHVPSGAAVVGRRYGGGYAISSTPRVYERRVRLCTPNGVRLGLDLSSGSCAGTCSCAPPCKSAASSST